MSIRRLPYFPRTVAVLLLLTGLASQIQVVFACDLMDGRPSPVCCCGEQMSDGCAMGGGCAMDAASRNGPDCCDVSVESLSDVTAGSPSASAAQVVLQKAPQPPPVLFFARHSSSLPTFHRASLLLYRPTAPGFLPGAVYLATNRLRL